MISWPHLLARVELRRHTPPLVLGYEDGCVTVTATLDQDAPAPRTFTARYPVPYFCRCPGCEVRAIAWLRVMLHVLVGHEVDEALHFEGRRVCDPHGAYRGRR